jgi:site-specific DNA-cytosine methylase
LSPRAAAGILRRAQKRGRRLPLALSAALSEPQGSTPAKTEPDEERRSSCLGTAGGKPGRGYPAARIGAMVRRLTPTECERLQGFPDGWTIPYGPSLAPSSRARTGHDTPLAGMP